MKKLMKWLFLVVMLHGLLFAAPQWYTNRDAKTAGANETIGYGEDTNLPNAILGAKTDISMQLQSHIKSSISMNTQSDNAYYTHKTTLLQYVDTDQILIDAGVVKQEFQGDRWYVAVSYDNSPNIVRFIKKLPSDLKNEKQNSYLANTMLGKEVNQLLGKNINFKLLYMNEQWNLNYKNVYQKVDIAIPDLFINHNTNPTNSFAISKKSKNENIILDGEDVYFKVASTKKYVTIFAMTPEGRVLVLEDNILTSQKINQFNFERFNEEERPTMFVAVFTNTLQDNSYFRIMQGNEERETYLNGRIKFDKFIEFIEGKEFVTKKMVIK
jgi:hypothetical protein